MNLAQRFFHALLFCATFAAGCRDALGGDTNLFLARIHTTAAGRTLPYRLLLPKNYEPARSYPVILYLHGGAGRGTDNLKPLEWGPMLFLEPGVRDKHDFFLVVPQCPRGSGWISGMKKWEDNDPMPLALELVRQVLPKEFRLDPKRRYLTGVSMGGVAVWSTMIQKPGFFAAAVPVCSGGDSGMVTAAAAKYPIWVFHSDDDPLMPVQSVRELVKEWSKQGGIAKYTEYTGLQHSSWKKAYVDATMFDWLFAQKLP